jgi:hypothetical protein
MDPVGTIPILLWLARILSYLHISLPALQCAGEG